VEVLQQHRQGLLSTTRDLTVGQWLEIWKCGVKSHFVV
jgi:hypothetical protein